MTGLTIKNKILNGEVMNIKCHICKLDIKNCNYQCVELDDVSVLYQDGKTEKDVIPDGFCTFHDCPHNLNGFKCGLDKCVL